MIENSHSYLLTRCQESKCKLTCGWENINHTIQPGCIRWVDPLEKVNPVPDYVSPFPKNIPADEWIPEIQDEVDDTPPLADDSDSESDSDSSEDENVLQKPITRKKIQKQLKNQKPKNKTEIFTKGLFSCPILDCPISNAKSWITASSLHKHIQLVGILKFDKINRNNSSRID